MSTSGERVLRFATAFQFAERWLRRVQQVPGALEASLSRIPLDQPNAQPALALRSTDHRLSA